MDNHLGERETIIQGLKRGIERRQADEYEKYVNGKGTADAFMKRKQKIRAELDRLQEFVSATEAENKRKAEETIRNKWFLDHSKGELDSEMAKHLIEAVVVGDKIEVRFREV